MKLLQLLGVSIGLAMVLASTPVVAQPCVAVDNGTGTVDLPPAGCGYVSPADAHMIIDGLPPGTTINVAIEHMKFFNVQQVPGGSPIGDAEIFDSGLFIEMTGTGALTGFSRTLFVQVNCEAHTGPRVLGAPVQTFPNDMFRIQGELFGDPDFDFLTITGGTQFGMPSPGQTTLTQLPSGDFNVDSFFDITYQIEFQGAPGSILDGLGGSTSDQILMSTGGAPPVLCPTADEVSINEIRIDQPGGDDDEYFELFGAPGTPLTGLSYIVIGDGPSALGSGVVEAVVDLTGQVIPASGFFVAAESSFTLGTPDMVTTLAFENSDNVTHMLVCNFMGAVGDDLDADDDCNLDATPWDFVVDGIALVEQAGTGECFYGPNTVGEDEPFTPGHVERCPDGNGPWQSTAFDPAFGSDTPGEPNSCLAPCTDPIELTCEVNEAMARINIGWINPTDGLTFTVEVEDSTGTSVFADTVLADQDTYTINVPGLAPGDYTVIVCNNCENGTNQCVTCTVTIVGVTDPLFIRGDCNADGNCDLGDAITTLNFLFMGAVVPCASSCDSNDDGLLNIADAISKLDFLFGGGGPLPPPNACGPDPTPDTLGCMGFPPCP